VPFVFTASGVDHLDSEVVNFDTAEDNFTTDVVFFGSEEDNFEGGIVNFNSAVDNFDSGVDNLDTEVVNFILMAQKPGTSARGGVVQSKMFYQQKIHLM
jgi:hypothetical protein